MGREDCQDHLDLLAPLLLVGSARRLAKRNVLPGVIERNCACAATLTQPLCLHGNWAKVSLASLLARSLQPAQSWARLQD